jgi:DNA-binding CsgD family transcriptional regulator
MKKNNLPWPSEEVYLAVAMELISEADAEKYEPLHRSERIFAGNQADEFVISFNESAHIKDVKDFTYKLSNEKMLNVFGCAEKELIGKNVTSFFEQEMMKNRWINDYAKKIHQYDLEVIKSKKPIKYVPDSILDKNGFVFAHSGLKIPLFGRSDDVTGIITLTFNITNTIKIRKLRQEYDKLYGQHEIKNVKFSEQIGVPLLKTLTEREIDCLIAAIRFRSAKLIARNLGISAKTVDMHLGNIREKLRCNFTDDLIDYFLTAIEEKGFLSV